MKVRTVILFFVLTAVAAWVLAKRLHQFAYWIARKDHAEIAAMATGGWSVQRLYVEPGVTLVGLVRPPRSADAPWLLFAPGNSSALLDGFRQVLDGLVGDRDLGLAFFAWRGFEASDGVPSPAGLRLDLHAAWRWLRDRGVPAERIELWGYSLGATVAAQVAAELADTGERPRRLGLIAVGERFTVMRTGLFGRFLPSHVYELTSTLPQLPAPIVIVHGSDDDALPIDGARRLAQQLGGRAVLHELPGKGHADLWPAAREVLLPR